MPAYNTTTITRFPGKPTLPHRSLLSATARANVADEQRAQSGPPCEKYRFPKRILSDLRAINVALP